MSEISVIVPVYNVEEYLEKCLDSIILQSYKDFELILVDDGSTDKSGIICDEYSKKDNRIKVIHKNNGGLSSARNAGLNVAIGDYIYFCDSDDYIENNCLEIINNYFKLGYDLVVFSYVLEGFSNNWTRSFKTQSYKCDDIVDFTINNVFCNNLGWEAWSRAYKRSIIEENNIRFIDNKRIFAEDLQFLLFYLPHAKSITAINMPLYHYMYRENSIMSISKTLSKINNMNELSKEVYDYYKSNGSFSKLIDVFPLIHVFILYSVLKINKNIRNNRKYNKALIKEINDFSFFNDNIKKFLKKKYKFLSIVRCKYYFLLINDYEYIIRGKYLLYKINNFLLIRCKLNGIFYRIFLIKNKLFKNNILE